MIDAFYTNLGQICEFVYGNSLPERDRRDGPYPVFGSNGPVGLHDEPLTGGPTIIVGRKGSVGQVHLSEVPCFPIDTTYYIEDSSVDCDFVWLFYLLKSLDLAYLDKSAAIPGLNRNDAYALEVCLPPLDEQRRIADILARADRQRRLTRYALQESEQYLQSVFLEMFGDPVTNPMGWNSRSVGGLCTRVIDCLHATPDYTDGETPYPCIRSSDIQNGYLDWATTKYLEHDEYITWTQRGEPKFNDVFYCREGARLGNAARIITERKVCLGQRMMLFRVNQDLITPEYFWMFLITDSTRKIVDDLVGGSASPHVNIGDLKKIAVPLPPLLEQQQYSAIVGQYDQIREQQHEAARQAEHLFESLLQRAFVGEL